MADLARSRVRVIHDGPIRRHGQYVLYWCQMHRRLAYNHALDYALELAEELAKPLVIYEGLKLHYPWASARFTTFLLEGMLDNYRAAKAMGLTYWPFVETPEQSGRGLVRWLAEASSIVVTDDYPAFIIPAQTSSLSVKVDVPIHAVDSNGVVPLSQLGPIVSAAAHLRPRLHRLFPDSWPHRAAREPKVRPVHRADLDPPFDIWQPPTDLHQFVSTLPINQAVAPVRGVAGGRTAGRQQLKTFIDRKLNRYAAERNQPERPEHNAASGISPWLHYGHLSIEEVVESALHAAGPWSLDDIHRQARNKNDYFCRDLNVNAFLDEAITWRDVGYHWHYCRLQQAAARPRVSTWTSPEPPSFNFSTMDFAPRQTGTLESVLPAWAWKTLKEHTADRREFVYNLEQLESAATHDELWNAAQSELVATGKMHNYLRMLWGKKVIEWSSSPEEAYGILEHLNNKYALDGRDPNSYTGILWCFGLFDRPWAPQRPIFGSVRYMSSANTARKFKLEGYYQYIRSLQPVEPHRGQSRPVKPTRANRLFE